MNKKLNRLFKKYKTALLPVLLLVAGLVGFNTDKIIQTISKTENIVEYSASKEQQADDADLQKFTGENFEELPKGKRIPVILKKHVDGDTSQFLINGHKVRVRYLLIDTPETVKPNTPPEPFGQEASDFTKRMLENADTIEIMLDDGERTDHYQRVLAYVFADDVLVQKELVSAGLAEVAYVKKPSITHLRELEKAENEAKKENKGIWSL